MKIRKTALAAIVGLAISAPSFAAQQVGGVTIDGWVLFETWVDRHNLRGGQTGPTTEETTSFVLHNLNISGNGRLDDAGPFNGFSWKLGNRGRNGNMGGTGVPGNREAWIGFDSDDYGSVKFGRFLLKGWEVLDYPYGSAAWQAEALAETGANWATATHAVRINAPRIADSLDIEVTHDVESTSTKGKASLNEIFARYSVGPVTFDAVYQVINDSPISKANTADGIYGSNADGSLAITTGNKQSMTFLGTRWNMGSGFEGMLAYKKNKWHSTAPGVLSGFDWGYGQAATPGTDVENGRVLLGLNYTTGKWQYNSAIQRVLPGTAGGLGDGATIIGGRIIRQVGKAANVYLGIRHTKFDSNKTPVDAFPWQVQSDAAWTAPGANTRLGLGGQFFF
jgi:predicted porin